VTLKCDETKSFKVLLKRWKVERTFSPIDINRRTAKHYERLDETAVAIVQLSAVCIMLNRF
jgi:putative transposase